MNEDQVKEQLLANELFNQLISDRSQEDITFTGIVYATNTELVPLFKYKPHCSEEGAKYVLIYLTIKKYEDMPSVTFADFYMTELRDQYHKVKIKL